MLEWTGERFLPWIKESTIAYEHLHRYAYASTLVRDKRALDLASGEGYGSNMLAAAAASVVGIDIDESVVRHAKEKYGRKNLQFISGSITAVPIPDDHSFDVIVCFEAIEHIEDQEKLLEEVKRLLKPGGLFIVSTPNKAVYHDESAEENPFHVKELYFEEFQQLLAHHFRNIQFLGQRIHPSSIIWPVKEGGSNTFEQSVLDRGDGGFELVDSDMRVPPMYFIAIASESVAAIPLTGNILVDQSDGLIKEKNELSQLIQKMERELLETKASAAKAIGWLDQQLREREDTITGLEGAVKWQEGRIEDLTGAMKWQEGRIEDLTGAIRQRETALEWQRQQISDLHTTIASKDEALAWLQGKLTELETAKAFWERESARLNETLQDTQRQLSVTSEQLEGIYASRSWKFITRLRKIRDKLMRRQSR